MATIHIPGKKSPAPATKAAPAKPGASKPGAPAAKAAPPPPPAKPGSAKPGAPKAPPPPPPKAAAAAPSKPGFAPKSPAQAPAAPKAAAAAPAAAGVTKAEFATFMDEVAKGLDTLTKRVDRLELSLSGFGDDVTVDDNGNMILDIENASEATLQAWSWQFQVGDHNADAETLRKAFLKQRSSKGFTGWVVQRDLAEKPQGEASEEVAEEAAEEEGEELTEEGIKKMNLAELTAVAEHLEIDISGFAKQPKVIRQTLIDALNAASEGGEEEAAAEEGEEGGGWLEEGTSVIVTDANEDTYPGTVTGVTEAGEYLVDFGDGSPVACDPGVVTVAE